MKKIYSLFIRLVFNSKQANFQFRPHRFWLVDDILKRYVKFKRGLSDEREVDSDGWGELLSFSGFKSSLKMS